MILRSISGLDRWFSREKRKPLVIRGARQVGKTTLVRHFAERRGLRLHEVNLERHLGLRDAFASKQISRIVTELEFTAKRGKLEDETSLLFIDEIQTIPEALAALRYLYEDRPRLAVVSAGSLLEFALTDARLSMPVGRIQYDYLGPMSFEEFSLARGEDRLVDLLRSFDFSEPFPEAAHLRLLELQRLFLMVGGMPEAVFAFMESESLQAVREVHASIIDTYRDDFAKYGSKSQRLRLQRIFDHIPRAIGEKIKYANIDRNEQARSLRAALDLLAQAQVVTLVHHVDLAGLPLRAGVDPNSYKAFSVDSGLVAYQTGVTELTIQQIQARRFINEGKLAEQFIAQHLLYWNRPHQKPELFYWLRQGRKNNAEVDFVVQLADQVIPIEVKAGKSGTLRSLLQLTWKKQLDRGLRFDLSLPSRQQVRHKIRYESQTHETSLKLTSLPFYMVDQAPRLLAS